MNVDPLFNYYTQQGPYEEQSIGPDQIFNSYGSGAMLETSTAHLVSHHQLPPTGFFPAPQFSSNEQLSPADSHLMSQDMPSDGYSGEPYTESPRFTLSQQSAGLRGNGMEVMAPAVYQSDDLFPRISTDLSMEKRRPAPLHFQEFYPTPDEPHFPHTAVGYSNEFAQYTATQQPIMMNPFPERLSQPTSPLDSSNSHEMYAVAQQTNAMMSSYQPQMLHPQQPCMSMSIPSPETHRMSFSSRTKHTKMPKDVKSRAKSVPNLHGSGIHTTQPGPIPASRPMLSYDPTTGEELLTFSYSKHKIISTFTIKCPTVRVVPQDLSPKFLEDNCVYPRARVPIEQYKGNRGRYERDCNEIGWTLAWTNPEIRNHRGLVQRAVDSWRNTRTDKTMRSRRVRKTEVKKIQ